MGEFLEIVIALTDQVRDIVRRLEIAIEQNAVERATPIQALGLSQRELNCLVKKEIRSVEQLIKMDSSEIMRIRGMGKHTFHEIDAKVKALGHKGWLKNHIQK